MNEIEEIKRLLDNLEWNISAIKGWIAGVSLSDSEQKWALYYLDVMMYTISNMRNVVCDHNSSGNQGASNVTPSR